MDPDLALFADVVAAGSLSAAARASKISVTTVSKRIARLERRLGVRLLNRTTRRLELTRRGEGFHREVVLILDALREAEARVSERTAEPVGSLCVSAPTSFGRMHMAPYLKPFLDAHPRIALELNLSDAFDDLFSQGIDLAVRITSAVPLAFSAHFITPSRRVLCAAPAYIGACGAPDTPAELANHQLLAATGQFPWRLGGADGALTVNGVSRVKTNSSEVVRELTLAGAGIALRSLWDVGAELKSGRLIRVLPEIEGATDVGIYIVHPRGRTTAAASALIAYLTHLWAPAPPWEESLGRSAPRRRPGRRGP